MTKPDQSGGKGQANAQGHQPDRTREHQWDKQGAGHAASAADDARHDPATDGKHRLAETRQQHDPAEKESEIRKVEEK